ncbi:GNAT family N-acetyltransferase [Galbitalea soli]|uniref:GNAT family N-acetyltransferase n=1 Tax=Galbitalea soli TaxID=1268042 RepID=A0A7C9TPP2_9MICO|nr:GNAT family N-acetyltransferase [Galbitalea soli]NEM90361.1 GNAT family N-acetyltransferase [Galbitalea soli]NYJ31071.1 GNAT superfamily N-acetyltransferase [Galbitalea soli]
MVGFRESAVDDAAAHALLSEYFESRAAGFPPQQGHYRATFPSPRDFVPPSGVFLIVEDVDLAGEPADVGCGGVRRIADGESGRTRFEIKHLYLQPHLRGRGFGRRTLAELEARAIALGAQELVLDTNAALEAAGALYRSMGYEHIDPYNSNPNATDWYGKVVSTAG